MIESANIYLQQKPEIIKPPICLKSNEPNTYPGFQQNALQQSLKRKVAGG